jgi:N6-adenosine-specific RNA methylase IME4
MPRRRVQPVRFRVVAADPAWPFGDNLPGGGRGARKHYRTMSVERICSFLVVAGIEVADDAALFLWRPAAFAEQAVLVARVWGFVPKTEMIWIKRTKHGKLHFGMGRTVRSSHETILVALRGRPERLSASVRSVFEAPVGRHSEKPDRFYELAEELFAGPRVELFARRQREGWTCLGDQSGS